MKFYEPVDSGHGQHMYLQIPTSYYYETTNYDIGQVDQPVQLSCNVESIFSLKCIQDMTFASGGVVLIKKNQVNVSCLLGFWSMITSLLIKVMHRCNVNILYWVIKAFLCPILAIEYALVVIKLI